jgi:hypothetical protein
VPAQKALGKAAVSCFVPSRQLFFAKCCRDTRQSLCRVPDKKALGKMAFADKSFVV